jgi:hypothetical protein
MGLNVPTTRAVNAKLAAVIAEAGLSHGQVAREIVRVAGEGCTPTPEILGLGRSHVSKWIAGVTPSGRMPLLLCEALSRKLGRRLSLEEIGLAALPSAGDIIDWFADTLVALTDLGRVDVDSARRRVLSAAAFSLTALALPEADWWERMATLTRAPVNGGSVGRSDVEAVRDMTALFSQMDQRRGGGHARTAVVQYLTSDVATFLSGKIHRGGRSPGHVLRCR